jgi:hypothetical protein
MTGGLRRIGVLGFSLIVLCMILLAAIVFQLYRGPTVVHANGIMPVTTASVAPALLPKGVTRFPPLRQFAETIERPLFDASRRPPAKPAPKDPGPPVELTKLQLKGVVMTPDKNLAVLYDTRNRQTTRVELGAALGEWALDDIRSDGVTFRKGGATYEMLLREEKAQTTTVPGGTRASGAKR